MERIQSEKVQSGKMELKFDVHMDTEVFYDYLLQHSFNSLSGILGRVAGVLLILGFFGTGQVILLIVGVILLCWLPCVLYFRSKRQMLETPAFREPIHYRLTEEGIEAMQAESRKFVEWEQICKATSTPKSVILYTAPVDACIFPRRDMGEKTVAVLATVHTHLPACKVRIKA